MDTKREFLRHTLATLAYRGGKAVKDAPAGFATSGSAKKTGRPEPTTVILKEVD